MEKTFKGTGKRKSSMAAVYMQKGFGLVTVNGKSCKSYFSIPSREISQIGIPLALLGLTKNFDSKIFVKGGGVRSQIDAIKLAMSNCLCQISSENRIILKPKLMLRSDSRIKERRKYGLKKARKAPQYSKR